jgi:hypothetical protein
VDEEEDDEEEGRQLCHVSFAFPLACDHNI